MYLPPSQVTKSKGQTIQAHQTPSVFLQRDQPLFGSTKSGLQFHPVKLSWEKIANRFNRIVIV